MANAIRSIIGFAASSAFVFAFTFEGLTGLGANLEANRALMEERVRLGQTSFGNVSEEAVVRNMAELDKYNATLQTEYKLFGCSADKPCR